MEARFSAQKKEYESCIAREKWQVKYDAQTSNGMGVGRETLKGHALCILQTIFLTCLPQYKRKSCALLLSSIFRLSRIEHELPSYVGTFEKSRQNWQQ